ncbi:VOC family protein [bacterium]|nr:VOC family protein [bacterium]
MADVNPIPDGFHTISAHMVIKGAKEAIEYYQDLFNAEVLFETLMPDGETVMNAEIRIGDSVIMIADELPMMKYWVSPAQLKGTTVGLHLSVDNVDEWFKRAEQGDVKVLIPPTDMFWGHRYCQFIDKFGHAWSIATKVEDVSEEEINERARQWMAEMAKQDG